MIDNIAAVLLQGLEAQCGEEGDRIVMVRTDELTEVEIEGSFDLRALALSLMPAIAAPVAVEQQFDTLISPGPAEAAVAALVGAIERAGGRASISIAIVGSVAQITLQPAQTET